MPLQPNTIAPQFTINDIYGNSVSLTDYRGMPVALNFFKWATCPMCNLHLHRLVEQLPDWPDLKVIAVFHSPKEALLEHLSDDDPPPVTIIADPLRTLYAQYEVSKSVGGLFKVMTRMGDFMEVMKLGMLSMKAPTDEPLDMLPADFLINPDGTIHTAHYGQDIGDHLSMEVVDAFVREHAFVTA